MKVELDKQALFALASDTRLDILKALQSNRRTVSQLAELLKIDKAAVHRHLKKLEEGGFVARNEDHGFVYYALTWKSRDILNPNDKTKIVILISSSLVCLLAMVLVVYLSSSASYTALNAAPADSKSGEMTSNGANVTDAQHPTPTSSVDPLVPTAVLGLAAFALLCSAYVYWRKPRQRGGEGKEVLDADAPSTVDD